MTLPQEFTKYGLQLAGRKVRRRLILTSEGPPKVGKTDLFLRTAPRPALSINLDMGDENVRDKLANQNVKDVWFKDVIVPPFVGKHTEAHRIEDAKIFKEMRELYYLAATKGHFRSIMIDEGAALYTLVRRAYLDDLDFGGSKQQSYAGPNAAMDRFYTLAKQNRVNLYIPHRQTEERETSVNENGKKVSTPTGRMKAAGWKESLYTTQCHLVMSKDPHFDINNCGACDLPKKKNSKSPGCTCAKFVKKDPLSKFQAVIQTCSNTKVEGTVLIGEDINWQTLGQLVFPGSEEEEWQ